MRTSVIVLFTSLFATAAFAASNTDLLLQQTKCETKNGARVCIVQSMSVSADFDVASPFPQCMSEESRVGDHVRTQRTCIMKKTAAIADSSESSVASSRAASHGFGSVQFSSEKARAVNEFRNALATTMSSVESSSVTSKLK